MCTLTWQQDHQLEIFFNRDEMKTRGRALPPSLHRSPQGTNYLSPIDPDAGGTWMLANEHGLIICLLNRWHETSQTTATKSRGKVVNQLCDVTSLAALSKQIPLLCSGCRPFDLIAFAEGTRQGFSWQDNQLKSFSPQLPMTSSSYHFEEVKAARVAAFETTSDLAAYQNGCNQTASAYTVRMNRPDAQTWSRSHLSISGDTLHWNYLEEFLNLTKKPQLHQSELKIIKS